MEKTLYIQNMVCNRCKTAVSQILAQENIKILTLDLGQIKVDLPAKYDKASLREKLQDQGFEWIDNPEEQLVESIKVKLIHLLHSPSDSPNLSDYLSRELHKEYSILSKTFRKVVGETLEKYYIKLKIERVKEKIQMKKQSFSEIAYTLGYRSISHLSGQFKTVTGMTMTEYRESQNRDRLPLDKIL